MAQFSSLSTAITEQALRRLAGDLYYQRGLDYFTRGRVASMEVWEKTIQAVVSGTENYAVEIAAKSNRLEFDCNCPLGVDGYFCKHCVAVALAWLHGQSPDRKMKAGGKPRQITMEDIARVLESEDKPVLVRLVLEWARENVGLEEALRQHTARALGPEAAVQEVKRTLERTIRVRRYVPYGEAGGYAGDVDSAIDSVEMLLKGGHAPEVIELCETALRWLVAAIENVDDSDGCMTGLMERLGEIHLRACEAAMPEPVALAKRLFRCEMHSEYGEFSDCAKKYANVFGPQGLRTFRQLAEAEWEKAPARRQEERFAERERYFRITQIVMSLARQSGDVEQLVAVLERDLSSAYQYLRIAEAYREAGRAEMALEWAEKGVAAFPDKTDARLRLFAAEEYQRQCRQPDALRILWLEFRDHPSLANYKLLEQFARKDDDWKDWRERALLRIRKELSAKPDAKGGAGMLRWAIGYRDHSLLVEIFLYERNIENAWQEAQSGGCSEALWLRLARVREKEQPEESVAIYLRVAEDRIVHTRSSRYEDAVELLAKASQAMQSAGRGKKFQQELEALRQKYKAKRNLQKLIEERRRLLYVE